MDVLADSSPLLADGPALRERFAADGCALLCGLLPATEIAALRAEVLDVLAESGWLDPAAPVDDARPGPTWINEGEPAFFPMYTRLQSLHRFHALAHHPALVQAMRTILDDEVLVHPRKVSRQTFPENPFGTTPPHQDYRFIQGTTDVLTAWIPLGDYSGDEGGLKIIPGSHTRGLLPPVSYKAVGGIGVDVPDDAPGWATADFRAGDVLVFHSLSVHGARPNQSERMRLSADFRYQSARRPIVSDTLHPHYWPDVPDWPALTGSWPSLDVIATPPGVQLAPYVNPTLDELPLDDSVFA